MSEHILCTWCKVVLNSTDKIYSTSCGHIFHFTCMCIYQRRSTHCPECLCIDPPTYEMFLLFENVRDENVSNEKMKVIELHSEIQEHKTNFLHLQEKYSFSQDLVRKLEEKNRISNNGFLQRAAIISDLEDRINELEDLNQFLTLDNECKKDALTLNSKQITELKGLWLKKEKGASGSKSNKEIKTFEGKFQSHSNELEKEMPPTQLSAVKTNLEEYVKLPGVKGTMTPNIRDNVNTNVALTNSTTGSSLWIKNFPKKDLIYPLKRVILTFVATIEGSVSENDIIKVYVKDGQGKTYYRLPDKVTLFVQFKNQNLKHKFLLNRAQIRQTSPSLELIEINKYNDEIE